MQDHAPYDVIGVGFGPAGIALAVAMEDADEAGGPAHQDWRGLFLEQAPDSAWQAELLFPGTDIQHHFLRDFATPRDPRSRFTFANYLKETGRLFPFCLLGGNVGRIEWSDYVCWAAAQVGHRVRYRHRVLAIEPFAADGAEIDLVRVRAHDLDADAVREFRARNIVLSTGRVPYVPPTYAPLLGPRVFHSHTFRSSIAALRPDDRPAFAVIGSGQSAIEIILHLADRFPESEIVSVHRNFGFRVYDMGHFSNQVYFPEAVDYVYSLSKDARRRFFEEVKFTNYSSVDLDVSRALYWRVYEEGLLGRRRIHVVKCSRVTEAGEADGRYALVAEDIYRGDRRTIAADVVILCTGYREEQMPEIVAPIRPYLHVDDDGDLVITRDYRVPTAERFRVGVFVSGLSETSHGISDATSFSMMALKSQRILEELDALRGRARPAARGAAEVRS